MSKRDLEDVDESVWEDDFWNDDDDEGFPLCEFPVEILEVIFCQIPTQDLFCTLTLVCKRWNAVINNPVFVPWKKFYHRLKVAPKSVPKTHPFFAFRVPRFDDPEVDDLVVKKKNLELAVPRLIRLAVHEFAGKMTAFEAGVKTILDDRDYKMAEKWFEGRNSLCLRSSSDSNPIGILVILCAIADDVWKVKRLLDKFPSKGLICELLHLIAAGFLDSQRRFGLPSRLHFNVFHAIYLAESKWKHQVPTSTSTGEKKGPKVRRLSTSSSGKYPLTAEQQRIASHPIDPQEKPEVIKIEAFAGTGKTTTLVEICRRNPHLRFLVLVYNKAAADYANEVAFKDQLHVSCKTIHSIARRQTCEKFASKMPKFGGVFNLNINDIKEQEMRLHETTNRNKMSAMIKKTVTRFMCSDSRSVLLSHVPRKWYEPKAMKMEEIDEDVRELVLENARDIWKIIANPQDPRIKLGHDAYLKIWQLEEGGSDLQKCLPHDVLMVDEGQDLNPVMIDVCFKRKTSARPVTKIIVGDPRQQIYQFRGAVNALNMIECDRVFRLTQSFRFGPEIAFAANCCIETVEQLKNVRVAGRKTLVGGEKRDELTLLTEEDEKSPLTVIGRTNAKLFDAAVQLICLASGDGDQQPRGKFQGANPKGKLFADLENLVHLKVDGRRYRKFTSFDELEKYALETNDKELLVNIAIVKKHEKYGGMLEKLRKIQAFCGNSNNSSGREPDYIFTTAHKSKGLEWDRVLVLDDFNNEHESEVNILYVAVTRAKKSLLVSAPIYKLLAKRNYHFERIVPVPASNAPSCSHFNGSTPSAMLLKRLPIDVDQVQRVGKVLCRICAANPNAEVNINNVSSTFNNDYRTALRFFVGPHRDEMADVDLMIDHFEAGQMLQLILEGDLDAMPGLVVEEINPLIYWIDE